MEISKIEKVKLIADKHGKLWGNEIIGLCIESSYYKDVNIVMELNNSGLNFTKKRSIDCETFFYIID